MISTRRLVDSDEEQALLEALIDSAKPPPPTGAEKLHYLLFTPFRHPPLLHGSRFGGRHERALWYGAEELRTAFAEFGYYRLLFLEGTTASLRPRTLDVSAFQAEVRAGICADLTAPPFDEFRSAIASPSSYAATRALGSEMRADGVEMIRFPSARDIRGGANVGLFEPGLFVKKRPRVPVTFACTTSRELVEFRRRDYFVRETFSFPRSDFEVDGRLPFPAAS